MYRPVDKRENYVKRCVGMPGDSLQIIDNQVYINGKPAKNPENLQFNYFVETNGSPITEEQFRLMDVSKDDRMLASGGGISRTCCRTWASSPTPTASSSRSIACR